MKFRVYRRWRNFVNNQQSWEYVCSCQANSKEGARELFFSSFSRYSNRDIRVEDARFFGYYIED